MLTDKTQILNRLGNSGCTVKSSSFCQSIKNPYLAQYKIFEERLRNPKMKSMSMIMKKKNKDDVGKENVQNELQEYESQLCLKQVTRFIKNKENRLPVFQSNTIDYDANQTSKQSEVLLKFKQKLQELKSIKSDLNANDRSRILSVNINLLTKFPRTQVGTSIGSQRKQYRDAKPRTAELFGKPRANMSSQINMPEIKADQKKLKLPLTFISYKRNKSFAQKFTRQKDRR